MNKFYSIYSDLVKKINHQFYETECYLPSESQLGKEYCVSRETVRKALAMLEENGYVQKQQGKGSFILRNNTINLPISGLISFAELDNTEHFVYQTEVIDLREEIIPKSYFLRQQDQDVDATHLTRLRIINGLPTIIDEDYIIKDIVPKIEVESIRESLYQYLEDKLHLDISYANKEITVEQASAKDCQLLDIDEGGYVVVVTSNVFLSDTRMLQVTVSKHRIDKFRFTEFARRKKLQPIS